MNELEDCDLDAEDLNAGEIFHGIFIPNPVEVGGSVPAATEQTEAGSNRLIIYTIELYNFKSYAGKVVVGPFNKCFTSVIGSNGCGKSNIIDALLFIFGFRSTKIRIKSLKNLIHNSDSSGRNQECSVTVNFRKIIDKSNGSDELVANSELSIRRTVRSDGQSTFYINDQKKNFKVILAMLKEKYGVDLVHNRFLILQGEVEQIALMKPKASKENETGFLEYIDDVIGTNIYEDCLKTFNVTLKTKYDERHYKIERAKIASMEKAKLEVAMKEAVAFLKDENRLMEQRNVLVQYEMRKNREQEVESRQALDDLMQTKSGFQTDFDAVELKRKEMECERNAMFKRVEDLEIERKKLETAFKNADEQDLKDQHEIERLKRSIKSTSNSVEKMQKQLKDTENEPEENQERLVKLTEHLESLKVTLANLNREHAEKQESFYEKSKPQLEAKRELSMKLFAAQDELATATNQMKTTEAKLGLLTMKSTDSQRKLNEIETSMAETRTKLDQCEQELIAMRQQIVTGTADRQKAIEESNALESERSKLNETIRRLQATVNDRKASMEQINYRSRVVNGLMREKQEGNLPGIYGRLGDLGGIDDRYDVAISTACPALDNIVVEDSNTAMDCIEFLKRSSLGSAYFIALDKQKHLVNYYEQPFNAPENVPRLFDLIQVRDERIRAAFYFALRDTLVAEDIEQATRIAYGAQRFRVVTLAGELIEMSGTMSGGGSRKLHGRMSKQVQIDTSDSLSTSSIQNQSYQSLEQDLVTQEARLNEITREQARLRQLIAQLVENIRGAQQKEGQLVQQIENNKKMLALSEKMLQETMATIKTIEIDEVEKANLERTIAKMKKNVETKQKSYDRIKSDIDKLEQEIELTRSQHFNRTETEIADTEKGIETEKNAITQVQYQLKNGKLVRKQTIDKLAKSENELKNLKTKLENLVASSAQFETNASEIKAKLKEVNDEVNLLTTNYSTTNTDYQRLLQKSNKLKAELIDLENRCKDLKSAVARFEHVREDLEQQKSQLKLNRIPKEEPKTLAVLTDDELDDVNASGVRVSIKNLELKLKNVRPNLTSIEDYFECEQNYLEKVAELTEVTKVIDEMKNKYEEIRHRRATEFFNGIRIISDKLKEMYRMLSMDGDAHLEIVDSFDPYSEGVTFNVRPPRKTWRNIVNLSGGEKTVASMALIFALHHFKPSPLYVMDEIDAALDFRNVSIIGHYIKQRTTNTQFIVVTLREHMYKLPNVLVGVQKQKFKSRAVVFKKTLVERDLKMNGCALLNESGDNDFFMDLNSRPEEMDEAGKDLDNSNSETDDSNTDSNEMDED